MNTQELDGKNLTELLDLLQEVPAPPPVSLWPQTPAWIVLGLAVIAAAGFAITTLRRHHQRQAYRKAALDELGRAWDDPAQIAAILRRTALAAFPRAHVAGLSGEDWLRFLDQTYAGAGFCNGPGRLLITAPYRDTAPSDALANLAQRWIKTHKTNGAT